jgi:hypothetical protein
MRCVWGGIYNAENEDEDDGYFSSLVLGGGLYIREERKRKKTLRNVMFRIGNYLLLLLL